MANDEGSPPTDTEDTAASGGGASEALANTGIADALKTSFAEYVQTNDVQPKQGDANLNLDWDFIRNHGGPLVAHMLSKLTRSLVPENLSFSVPTKSEEQAEGDDSKADSGSNVNVNLDLGDFLGKLFQPPERKDS